MSTRQLHLIPSLVVITLCLGALPAWFCDIPVFYYALKSWPPSAYELDLTYRGTLPKLASSLTAPDCNLKIRLHDLDQPLPEEVSQRWNTAGKPESPHLFLGFPRTTEITRAPWSGPATKNNFDALKNSPARSEIARRIVGGHSTVWVFINSGNPTRDKPALTLLTRELAHLEKTLKLPLPTEQTTAEEDQPFTAPTPPLKIKFSIVELRRNDPTEQILIQILTRTEEDLREMTDQPMTFPIFGRGRALYAIAGEGITKENITLAAEFLVHRCSCLAKEENPGTDIPFTMAWEDHIDEFTTSSVPERPLVGLGTLTPQPNQPLENPIPKFNLNRYLIITLALLALLAIITLAITTHRQPKN